jgi:hypothetical protein
MSLTGLPPLPDHAPGCRPQEGFCTDDCPRWEAIVEANWGRPEPVGVIRPADVLDEERRSMDMLGIVLLTSIVGVMWFVGGMLLGAWLW